MDIKEILQIVLRPVIEFLQKEGLWDPLVDLFYKTIGLISELFFWLDAHLDFKKVLDFIVAAGVFIFKLVVVVIGILVDIIQWIVGLFL